MGWDNAFHCEINPFCVHILKHYWPNAKTYNDITRTDFTPWAGKIDILTGGFPCQPYSVAGKRLGKEDERHLWPDMLRAIREIKPRWVVGENVRGLVNWSNGLVFDEVQSDLESAGFKVLPCLLPACGVNAPHRRERIWFVAYSGNKRRKEREWFTRPEDTTKNTTRLEFWFKRFCKNEASPDTQTFREQPGQQSGCDERRIEQLESTEQRGNADHNAETRDVADTNNKRQQQQ
ncbi:DNA (cytosine-5-)-methyltransferase [Acinetobacter sp.]|uniref:DNA cytosine methyltransferase n=1 Tax=Acinetobacter sp. TaxID=472 RepID=UPI003459AD1D